jgi:hypothetical protein
MKKQIRKFPPHQNAKVFAVLMAVCIIPFFIPMALMMSFTMPAVDQNGNPIEFPFMLFLFMPFLYLIFGYISVSIGCFIYNFLYKFVGGIEIETDEKE